MTTPEEIGRDVAYGWDRGKWQPGVEGLAAAISLAIQAERDAAAERLEKAVLAEREACKAVATKRAAEYYDANEGLSYSAYRDCNDAAADACREVAAEINARGSEGGTP